ncbi:hypothetical protein F5Y18DRAFT_439436 [Xylariaceae sp. FL1019]|nr:hypothetical protein F5Y18DRAFT_439436 [Xylariaceae sp. FL1019]
MCKGWKFDHACGHIDSHYTSFCTEKCSTPNGPTTYLDTACQQCDPEVPRKTEKRQAELMTRFFGADCVRETQDIDETESVQTSAPPSPISASFFGCRRTFTQRRRDSDSDSDGGGGEKSYIADDGKVIQTRYILINGHYALTTHRMDPKDVDPSLVAKLQAKRQKKLAKLEAMERRRRLKEQEATERLNRDQNVKRAIRRESHSEGMKRTRERTGSLDQAETAIRETKMTHKTEQPKHFRSTSDRGETKKHGVKDKPSQDHTDTRHRRAETETSPDVQNEGMKHLQMLLEKERRKIREEEEENRRQLEEQKKIPLIPRGTPEELEEAEILNDIVRRSSQVVKGKKKTARSFSERMERAGRLQENLENKRGEDHDEIAVAQPDPCVRRRPKHESLRDLF